MRTKTYHQKYIHASETEENGRGGAVIRKRENNEVQAAGSGGDEVFALPGADQTYRSILETLNEGVAVITPRGKVLYCNRCLAEILCLPAEKILGGKITDFCQSEYHPALTSLMEKGLGGRCKGEIGLRDEGDGMIPVQVSCNSLYLESPVLCLIFTDLRGVKDAQLNLETARAQLEKKKTIEVLVKKRTNELLNAQAELKKKERLSEIGTLAATVAHELRNPLAVIGIIAYNLKRETRNQPELAKYIEDIDKKISQSSQIIDNLLSYSRIKPPRYEDVPVYELINNCLLETKENFKDKEVELSTNVSSLRQQTLRADLFQVNQILNNVLRNAWEAAPRSGGKIGVSGKFEKGHIVIKIRDNGNGIPPEHIENVFKPFFTLKSKGTGLGLAVCREMIRLHDGKIELASVQGKGTTVTLFLPQGAPHE